MWSIISRVGGMLGLSEHEPQVDLNAIYAVLDRPDDPVDDEQRDEDEWASEGSVAGAACQHRVGVVSSLYDRHGFVTSGPTDVYFRRQDGPDELKVGDKVVYLAYRVSEDREWVVRKILYVENETWDRNEGDVVDSEEIQPAVVMEECEMAYKSVIAKVTGRSGRTVLADNLQFCLDSVLIPFIPVEGDWLVLQSLVQSAGVDEPLSTSADTVLSVSRVSPVRERHAEGAVTHWSGDTRQGIISHEVVFTRDACEPGYLPHVGDEVAVYCIESEQGQLTWRAVHVTPTGSRPTATAHDSQDTLELLRNKHGIVISEDTNCGVLDVGQEADITVQVKNTSTDTCRLEGVQLTTQPSQFRLSEPSSLEPMDVRPDQNLHFVFTVKARCVGRSTEQVLFQFSGFAIARQLVVDVQTPELSAALTHSRSRTGQRARHQLTPLTAKKLLATRNGFIIHGVRPIKPASFVPVRLGMFVVPEKLLTLVMPSASQHIERKEEVIGRLAQDCPYLTAALEPQTYVLRWDTLVHLEEIEHATNIARYNTQASLHRVQDYLSLEIPGLSERRPSLITGDKVIARDAWSDHNSWADDAQTVGYEGFIHKVLSNEILIKFNPSFHDQCSGVYSISFETSRTQFRREHQAIHVAAKNFGADWLFPSQVVRQPPQIVITQEDCYLPEDQNHITSNSVLDDNKTISSKAVTDDHKNYETVVKEGEKEVHESRQKISERFEQLSSKDGSQQKKPSPRVPVVERFLRNGNCCDSEKGSKEVKIMLHKLANLSTKGKSPVDKPVMKTLEQIENQLLKSNSITSDVKQSPEVGSPVPAFSKFLSENNLEKSEVDDKKMSDGNIEKEVTDSNKVVQTPFRPRDRVKWNSNEQMKAGTENEADCRIPVRKRRTLKWFNPCLNHYQKEAVRNILKGEARPLPYVIFGPPGTGKTITLVETLLQIYFLIPESRILVGTPSNSSADLVCERLLDCGLLRPGDLLRLVGYQYAEQGRVTERLRPYCGTADIKARDDTTHAEEQSEGVVNLSRHAIGRHRVTVGTCSALGVLYQMGFPRGHFTHVLVDEAGQAKEPETLIPLVFLSKSHGQVVLAGDPLQLGPVVISKPADHYGLGHSLLARLLTTAPYCRDTVGYSSTGGYNPLLVTRLLYNYRSLPAILDLPNAMFYDGDLIPQVSETDSEEARVLASLSSLLTGAVTFHGVRGTNCQAPDSPSWYNPHEAVQTVTYLQALYTAGLAPDQCGIITPYQAQVLKIRHLLEALEMESPKVGSVEEFQGQERLVMILSTVRSSPRLVETDLRHTVGFVASPRRLNVAITRARAALIVIGNPHLLARDQYWRSVLEYCVSRGAYTGCDLPKLTT